tara:strand:+ start:15356 stop:16090 length:735 start_codon:yes stop_codon:yes gene_type:complete
MAVERHGHTGADAQKVRYSDLEALPVPIDQRHIIHMNFETDTRYAGSASGAGAARTYDTNGLTITSGTASSSYSFNELNGDLASLNIFDHPLSMTACINWNTESDGTHYAFVVFGAAGAGSTSFEEKHFGFVFQSNAAGGQKIKGSTSNGSTSTKMILDTSDVTQADDNLYTAVFIPKQSCSFYINGKKVGIQNDVSKLPSGAPTDTTVWAEQKSIRANSGTANTLYVRWHTLYIPFSGLNPGI